MSMPEDDAQLPLKKRARRRLIGAVALTLLAAVVLPMVMDPAPQAPDADVEIRIPARDRVPPFEPAALATAPSEKTAARPVEAPAGKIVEKTLEKPAAKAPEPAPAAKSAEKAADKPAEKTAEKTAEKVAEKPAGKSKADADDGRRAAAILAGRADAPAALEHVILIGAFANPANVRLLQSKLGELGIKVYTEALDSPQGKKTRVRAGPFPSREAAEKALARMQRIGVNGVLATR
ncbi:MAG: SPOR domain-containing protein [Azospira sp.]|jgi:DedD protein|nr:SPOR domain-containing protein [Azospira sp.]